MNRFLKLGRIMFAIGFIGLGVLCFISKDFIVGRPPVWPGWLNVNPALAYFSGTVLILSAMAILMNWRAGMAALSVATLIFVLSVLRHLPQFMNDWANAYKSIALAGGALILGVSFFREQNKASTGFKPPERWLQFFLVTGCLSLSAFFIVCGYAHFKFAEFVEQLIPAYIPFHTFWAYFCGVCLLAGGIGLLLPATRRLAAILSGFMVSGWFLLLHVPRFLANMNDVSDRMGVFESLIFAGIFFVLAGVSASKK